MTCFDFANSIKILGVRILLIRFSKFHLKIETVSFFLLGTQLQCLREQKEFLFFYCLDFKGEEETEKNHVNFYIDMCV